MEGTAGLVAHPNVYPNGGNGTCELGVSSSGWPQTAGAYIPLGSISTMTSHYPPAVYRIYRGGWGSPTTKTVGGMMVNGCMWGTYGQSVRANISYQYKTMST